MVPSGAVPAQGLRADSRVLSAAGPPFARAFALFSRAGAGTSAGTIWLHAWDVAQAAAAALDGPSPQQYAQAHQPYCQGKGEEADEEDGHERPPWLER